MRVCDVVLNSIWYDPRVRKQIIEYMRDGSISLSCVGLKCNRFDAEKVLQIPCPHTIVEIDSKYDGKQGSLFRKLKREYLRISRLRAAIINYHPSIIHANDLDALIPSYLASRKLKCRIIYDSHEINVENYIGMKRNFIAFLMERIESILVNRVDQMISVSNASAEYFQDKYKINKPMVITNCCLLKDSLAVQSVKASGFEVLNHGQFYEGRGYELMIEASKYLMDYPDIFMALRGFGRNEAQLRRLALGCKTDHIRFYPRVNVEQLIPEASKSMVGVAITVPICLNFKLSVSNKIFEYAAAGLPVIMSDIPEHRYLNDKYHFGIILENNTPKCFADAVLKLFSDKLFYERCAENSRTISKEINWENEFAQLIRVEKEMLNK